MLYIYSYRKEIEIILIIIKLFKCYSNIFERFVAQKDYIFIDTISHYLSKNLVIFQNNF